MEPSAIYKRSSFYKFGTHLFLIILLGAIVSSGILYFILPKELPSTYTDALKELRSLKENLYLKTYLIYLPLAVFIFIGVIALSLSLTKKIIAPLIATLNFSRVLASGDFSKRPPIAEDDLSPLIGRINELINAYQERLGSMKESISELESIQKDIDSYLKGDANKDIKKKFKELIEATEKINKILEKIRV